MKDGCVMLGKSMTLLLSLFGNYWLGKVYGCQVDKKWTVVVSFVCQYG